ncbi:hypothetical protein FF38_14152 [Lucilia cuprina]|uniref:Uncharacterized protein n=1 Tax=Lucilia cuprina TaxID=7375 RepID=A0A0L0BSW2_LUCCU|nr:hypothetical protein FF38_14152 [Lucilia cuprina]
MSSPSDDNFRSFLFFCGAINITYRSTFSLLKEHVEEEIRYEEARKWIFGITVNDRINKCRLRFTKRKHFKNILESTTVDDERPFVKILLGTIGV